MELGEFNFLKHNRRYTRSKVFRIHNTIESNMQSLDLSVCENYISDLKDLGEKCNLSNVSISKGIWQHEDSQPNLGEEITRNDDYDQKIVVGIKTLESRVKVFSSQSDQKSGLSSDDVQERPVIPLNTQLKLPQLPLPTYKHAPGESLHKFFLNMEAVLNKYTWSSYEKYIFLEKQLTGDALQLVSSLHGDEQSYDVAKNVLLEAYGSIIIQKFELIESLPKLKLDSNGNCFSFVGDMNTIFYLI